VEEVPGINLAIKFKLWMITTTMETSVWHVTGTAAIKGNTLRFHDLEIGGRGTSNGLLHTSS
jgi:hypothetical protein